MKQKYAVFSWCSDYFFLLFPLTFIPLFADTYLNITIAPLLVAIWKSESYFRFLSCFNKKILCSKLFYNCVCIAILFFSLPFALLITILINTNIKTHTALLEDTEIRFPTTIIKNLIIVAGILCGAIAVKYPHIFVVIGILYGNALLFQKRMHPKENFRVKLICNQHLSRRILLNSFSHNFIYYLYG